MPEPVEDGVHADVGEDPFGRVGAHEAQRVVEAVAPDRTSERLADPERDVVAHDRERRRGGSRARGEAHPHRAASGAGNAVELVVQARVGETHLEPVDDRPAHVRQHRPRPAGLGAGHIGPDGPLTGPGELAAAERGEHGEDLVAVDPREHARLRREVAAHDLVDFELDDRGRAGELEVLRGRPHQRPPGDAFDHFDRGTEPAAAEQRALSRTQPAHDRQSPDERIERRLESVESERVQNGGA